VPYVIASDGTRLHYEDHGAGRTLILIHGWSFSGRFFNGNVDELAAEYRVIVVDLRGHGESDKPDRGYRVARLAKDLFDLIEALELEDVTVLGWSIGASIIWSYLELFGNHRLAACVFVQQVPRQYYGADWKFNHTTCFDEPSLARLQTQVEDDLAAFDQQQLTTVFHTPPNDIDRSIYLAEMAKAPPRVRNALMADHTRHDWRDQIPAITLPSLVLVARNDATYPWPGPAWVGENIAGARTEFFEDSGHALFIDEADKFNGIVRGFLATIHQL
jgi:non-heme chloroperoxidase